MARILLRSRSILQNNYNRQIIDRSCVATSQGFGELLAEVAAGLQLNRSWKKDDFRVLNASGEWTYVEVYARESLVHCRCVSSSQRDRGQVPDDARASVCAKDTGHLCKHIPECWDQLCSTSILGQVSMVAGDY